MRHALALLTMWVLSSGSAARAEGRALSAQTRAFARIAAGDYRGEHVIHRDALTTTFLDVDDPAHPRSSAWGSDSGRAHVLVIPNQQHGLLSKSQLIAAARRRASALGIQDADVYINRGLALHSSWPHAHIEGSATRAYGPSL
jgi:hypothetical protein